MNQISKLAKADSPFRLNVAPEQAFAHPNWREARTAALDHLRHGRSVALLGLPGTGKTLLLQELARTLHEEDFLVRFVERGDALHEERQNEILLVDEAGAMEAETLGRLCGRRAPCVLAALPGFAERLAELECSIASVTLEPLGPDDVAEYVSASLAAAGQPADLLERDAVLALAGYSRGLLRVVNALGGAAMFLARMEGDAHVGQRHVDEANAMRHGPAEQAPLAAAPAEPPERPEPDMAAEPPPARPLAEAPPELVKRQEPDRVEELPPARPPAELPPAPARVVAAAQAAPVPQEVEDSVRLPPAPQAPAVAALRAEPEARFAPTMTAAAQRAARRRRGMGVGAMAAVLALGVLGVLALVGPVPIEERTEQVVVEATQPEPAPAAEEAPADPLPTPPPPPADAPARTPDAPRSTMPPKAEAPPRPSRPAIAPVPPSPPAAPPPAPAAGVAGRENWQRDLLDGVLTYQGGVYNETIRQRGRLMLSVRRQGPPGAVTIRFDASNGLLGSGVLTGYLSEDGRLTASGTLLMRQTPFDCEISGVVTGSSLTGSATFLRSDSQGSGGKTRSTFSLARS